METKVFLNKNKGKNQVNRETAANFEIIQNQRILPCDQIIDTVDDYQLYLDEREKSDKYRLIFSIMPMCTNVLFNPVTEIIKNEGSSSPVVLTSKAISIESYAEKTPLNPNYTNLTRTEAIRDTEYSHPLLGKFTYHCGLDIFNNHLLRNTGFNPIQKMSDGYDSSKKTVFNTIEDYKRDYTGNVIIEQATVNSPIDTTPTSSHTYTHDNLLSFEESYANNIFEEDGYFGFDNPSNLLINMSDDETNPIFINKTMNNNKGCEFYEMYPDRSLFSFIPKINKYREGREEYNWDWCLTYPASSEYAPNGCDVVCNEELDIHGLKIVAVDEGTSSAQDVLLFKTIAKHNLSVGDNVKINFRTAMWESASIISTVVSLGNTEGKDKDLWFRVSEEDILDEWGVDNSGEQFIPSVLYAQKQSHGLDCDYYFRMFRKLPNFKKSGIQLRDDDILTDAQITAINQNGGFRSTLGKMGFQRGIYNDMVAELLYNDDISVKHLVDNRGRKLSELYLTLIKDNKGYKKWYEDKDYGNEDITYSHCFSDVTSGFEIEDEDVKDYNVHYLHNVDRTADKVDQAVPVAGKYIESGITIDNEYYIGDIVEWDPYNIVETSLMTIQHRFNTYQRENTVNDDYMHIYHDELVYDDNDAVAGAEDKTFKCETKELGNNYLATIFPEGYYYKPHYKILLREFSDTIETYGDVRISYNKAVSGITPDIYTISTLVPHGLLVNDDLILRLDTYKFTAKVITIIDANTFTMEIDSDLLNKFRTESDYALSNSHKFEIYLKNTSIPVGAQYVPFSKGVYHYRAFKEFYNSDDTKLKNSTFTNGAIYLEHNINFYLKRQDPFAKYGLNITCDGYKNKMSTYYTNGTIIDTESEEYVEESDMTTCE